MGLNVEKVDLKQCCCVREESGCFSKGNGKEFVQYLQLCRVPNEYCRRCANDEHAPPYPMKKVGPPLFFRRKGGPRLVAFKVPVHLKTLFRAWHGKMTTRYLQIAELEMYTVDLDSRIGE